MLVSRRETDMKSDITVCVSADGKLEVPAEIQTKLQPGDRYQVIVTGDKIVFEKVKAGFDWEEWERRVEAANPNPDQLTMEEICEIVREVRREKCSQTEP
jgi:bifunctional DNA-binding transcriptional regulator/antitoxin component of YhaV-PrlF toxin-antitoxin module